MKILKYTLLLSLIVVFAKCSPDNNGSFGETIDRTAQLQGTWKITSVSQVDLDAEKKGFPDFATTVDITNAVTDMPFSDFVMTINNGSISTTLGSSPMSFVINGGDGNWEWMTNEEVELVNQTLGINASEGIVTNINGKEVELLVSSFAGVTSSTPTLSLNYKRIDDLGNDVLRYEYVFEKQ